MVSHPAVTAAAQADGLPIPAHDPVSKPIRAGARTRLRATLRAWLDNPGQVTVVAGELHVHPQTVRYRVAQLRELFGERLDDPEARFELALALRAEPG